MGVRIIIGSSERKLDDVDPNWVNEQVNRRRSDGAPVCVRVIIESADVNISLVTSDCPSSGHIRRPLTDSENDVVKLWDKLHLNESNFSSGNIIAFLKQLRI